jgi:hypothetical protein
VRRRWSRTRITTWYRWLELATAVQAAVEMAVAQAAVEMAVTVVLAAATTAVGMVQAAVLRL